MSFTTDYQQVLQQFEAIDPVTYGKTRNFADGAVTRLSPYISRGVISTKQVMEHVLGLGHPFYKVEKFIQELAWRDYWQQVWLSKGDLINQDLKRPQAEVQNWRVPRALVETQTGIEAIDDALLDFYESGYLHNHVRMYVAAIACNMAKSHWREPARWMYYHLIDGDWASNALSWQWVAGANAGKKYIANQDNINKYCYSNQRGTFLDLTYEEIADMDIPAVLEDTMLPDLETPLPGSSSLNLDPEKPLLIYNYYNLDPSWRSDSEANRVLLIEPSIFEQYPISQKAVDFMMGLAKNITDIQVYVGEFEALASETSSTIYFKEHPLNLHYQGVQDRRDWMFSVTGYYPSFFAFWKKCKKELK